MTSPATRLVDGRTVTLPCVVRDASAAHASFLVNAEAAHKWLPSDRLALIEPLPGRALLNLTAIDYRDNDLGSYHEVAVALVVRDRADPRGRVARWRDAARGRLATYIHRLPVDQPFTCAAGRLVWGFPKTLDTVRIDAGTGHATAVWVADGEEVLRFAAPRGGKRSLPETTLTTYTLLDGRLQATRFTLGAQGVRASAGGARLVLGTHPFADELRALGLPRRPIMTTWIERLHGRFDAPQEV